MTKACTRRTFASMAMLTTVSAVLGIVGCARSEEPAPETEPGAEASPEPSTVHVFLADKPGLELAGLYVARERGYFAESNITVEIASVQPDASASEHVQMAQAEYCIVDQQELAAAFGGDEPYSVLAIAALLQPEGLDGLSQDAGEQATGADGTQEASGAPAGYPALLVGNDSYLLQREDEARLVVDAIRRGYRYTAEHPDRAAELLAEPLGVKAGGIQTGLEKLAPRFFDADGTWGSIAQELWDGYFAHALKSGDVMNKIPAHHGYSTDYLEEPDK